MKLFYLILGVLFIVASGIAILSPLNKNETLAGASLSISTFLFGVFIAFSISDRHNRINSIRENDSIERAGLESLYSMSMVFGNQRRVAEKIDNYLMAVLDYVIWDYNKTGKEFKELVETATSVKVKNRIQAETYNSQEFTISSILTARKQTTGLIDERLSKLEWLVLFVLGGVIVFSLLLVGTTTVQTISVVLLITFTIMVLLAALYTLDNL